MAVARHNFFEFLPGDVIGQTGLVAINPPYGIRLESIEKSNALFQDVCDRLKQAYGGWNLILVAPDRKLVKKMPFKLEALPFFHGGLNPALLFGKIP